jgi:hypothetical protein
MRLVFHIWINDIKPLNCYFYKIHVNNFNEIVSENLKMTQEDKIFSIQFLLKSIPTLIFKKLIMLRLNLNLHTKLIYNPHKLGV